MDFNKLREGKINVNSLLFLILVIVYCCTSTGNVGSENSIYKYLILIVCIIDSFLIFNKKKREGYKPVLNKEFKGYIFFIGAIIIYSIIKSIEASHFSFRTIKELLFLVCPIIYSYLAINTFKKEDIYNNMRISFWITFSLYIFSLNIGFKEIIQAMLNSSFSNSTSALESHVYCGLALAYFIYFCYYDRKKMYKILSLIFVFMTFKRLFIVMSLFLFFFEKFKIKDKFVSKKVYYICAIGLILMSILYYQLIQPQNVIQIESKWDISMSKLTSTRTDRLRALLRTSYKSYGFGSSTEYMYKHLWGALEMDIVKIIIELGYIPVILLIFSYLYFSRANYYTFFVMIFQILNLIFSSSLTGSFTWIMIFITIGVIWDDTKNKCVGEVNEISKCNNTSI